MKIVESLGHHAGGAWIVLWAIHGWSVMCTAFLITEIVCLLFVAMCDALEKS